MDPWKSHISTDACRTDVCCFRGQTPFICDRMRFDGLDCRLLRSGWHVCTGQIHRTPLRLRSSHFRFRLGSTVAAGRSVLCSHPLPKSISVLFFCGTWEQSSRSILGLLGLVRAAAGHYISFWWLLTPKLSQTNRQTVWFHAWLRFMQAWGRIHLHSGWNQTGALPPVKRPAVDWFWMGRILNLPHRQMLLLLLEEECVSANWWKTSSVWLSFAAGVAEWQFCKICSSFSQISANMDTQPDQFKHL